MSFQKCLRQYMYRKSVNISQIQALCPKINTQDLERVI